MRTMLSDHEKVQGVTWAYRNVLIDTRRATSFLVAKVPPTGSTHYKNCVQFVDSAEEFGVSIVGLMKICLDNYSPWWCQKIFKRPYPPQPVVVAEKARNKALKNFTKTMVNAKPDEVADFYVAQLRGFGETIATGLILNGMCGDDKAVQSLVLNKLREERMK